MGILHYSVFVVLCAVLWVALLQDFGPVSKHRLQIAIKDAKATNVYEFLADVPTSLPVLHALIREVKTIEKTIDRTDYVCVEAPLPFLTLTYALVSYEDVDALSVNLSVPNLLFGFRASSLFTLRDDETTGELLVVEDVHIALPRWWDVPFGTFVRNFVLEHHRTLLGRLRTTFEPKQ